MEKFDCYPDKLIGALQTMGAGRGYLYTMTLLRIYKVGGPIDDTPEELARLTGMTTDMVVKCLEWLMQKGKLMRTGDGRLMNPFAAREIAKARDTDSQEAGETDGAQGSDAGDAAEPRKRPARGKTVAVKPYRVDSVKKESPAKKPASSRKKSPPAIAGKAGTDGWPADAWAQFWANVPRKVGHKAAQRAFERVRKSGEVSWAAFFAGVIRWNAEAAKKERQFICHPATWLNQGRWADEPEPAAPLSTGARNGKRSIWDVANGSTEPAPATGAIEIFAPGEPIPQRRDH